MIAAAVAPPDAAVGIDIERHASRDVLGLVQTWFGPNEIAVVEAAGPEAFYRIWTAREALAKALGSGLSGAMKTGDAVGYQPGEDAWTHEGFHFGHQPAAIGYSLAVVTNAPPIRYMAVDVNAR
jgi:4'-phosphopantetheinyl transferase